MLAYGKKNGTVTDIQPSGRFSWTNENWNSKGKKQIMKM